MTNITADTSLIVQPSTAINLARSNPRTPEELALTIDSILTAPPNQDDPTAVRLNVAKNLASVIDSYVQYQIGARLVTILTALNAGGGSVDRPVPVTRGPDFDYFSRTS